MYNGSTWRLTKVLPQLHIINIILDYFSSPPPQFSDIHHITASNRNHFLISGKMNKRRKKIPLSSESSMHEHCNNSSSCHPLGYENISPVWEPRHAFFIILFLKLTTPSQDQQATERVSTDWRPLIMHGWQKTVSCQEQKSCYWFTMAISDRYPSFHVSFSFLFNLVPIDLKKKDLIAISTLLQCSRFDIRSLFFLWFIKMWT